tara:strand:+ start:1956 stop:2768 length:813 start_codon:yes stop_codon:yes gene_type:complete
MRVNSLEDSAKWASFRNINLYIDQNKILSNINLNLNYGENTVILGPNGSGKSSFLKLLNRSVYPLISKDSSLKLFENENINIWDIRKRVGFLFKEMEHRVKKDVKLYDLIVSGFSGTFNSRYLKLLTNKEKEKIEELINQWELEDIIQNDFKSLSDGQKRRALLARAMVFEPKILVLDEPFCNLDIKSNYILNRNLISLINKSVNIIYVTHNLESILAKTNRVLMMKRGTIINDGNPNELINSKTVSDLFEMSVRVVKQDDYWRSIPIDS